MNLQSLIPYLQTMFVSILLIGLSGVIGIYIFYKRQYEYWSTQNIRVTIPKFPLGDIYETGFSKNIGIVLKEIYDKFRGERYNGMWFFYRPYIMIRDPDLIKLMLVRDFNNFKHRGLYFNEKIDPLSANLFFLDGSKWRNLRAKLSSNFSSGKMKKMFNVMSTKGSKLQETLQRPAEEEEIIEPKEYVVRYTHDVVASSFLSFQADCIQNPSSTLVKMGQKVFEASWSNIIKTGFSFFVPTLANALRIAVTPREVTHFFLRTIKSVMEFREKEHYEDNPNDFMRQLVKLKNQGYVEDVDVKDINGNVDEKAVVGTSLSCENTIAQAFIFWVGAFETSAVTMQFALYEMSLNYEIQEKAREEVRRVLAKFNGKLTYESLSELEYLGRIIDETLRKYPPVPLLTRVCLKTYQIPDSDVVIEKNIPILISVLGLHMDPNYYPDPEKFDPDRFTDEEKRKRHHYVYLPFGEGLRQCIGQRYALMQIKVGLANLIANYKFEVAPKTPKKPVLCRKVILYAVENGIPLKISKLID